MPLPTKKPKKPSADAIGAVVVALATREFNSPEVVEAVGLDALDAFTPRVAVVT